MRDEETEKCLRCRDETDTVADAAGCRHHKQEVVREKICERVTTVPRSKLFSTWRLHVRECIYN